MPSAVCHAATPKIVQSQSPTFRLSSKPRNTSLHTNLERITVSFGLANHVAMWMLPRAFCPPLVPLRIKPHPHRFLRQTCKEGSTECCFPCRCGCNHRVQKKHHAMQSGAYTYIQVYVNICTCAILYTVLCSY